MKNCSRELKHNRGDTRLRLVLCSDASSRLPQIPLEKTRELFQSASCGNTLRPKKKTLRKTG